MGMERTVDEYVQRIVSVFHEAKRVLSDDGTLWLNLADSYASRPSWGRGGNSQLQGRKHDAAQITADSDHRVFDRSPKNLLGIPWRSAFALQDDGWILRSEIIWHAANKMPESVTDRPTKAHEQIFMFCKQARYFYDNDAVREPLSQASVLRLHQRIESQRGSDRVPGKGNGAMKAVGDVTLGRNMRDVWEINTQPFTGAHFATFPTALPERCIKAGSRIGDVVLDPFSGSGTTGQAANKLGRRYVGIDLNEEYLAMSLRTRLSARPLIEGAA
jgi:site-specific DNA-methyltransferase (cytosine-N4-specific)